MMGEPQDVEDDVSIEAIDWLLRLREGENRTENEQAFAAWVAQSQQHRDAFTRAERVWAITGALDPLEKPVSDRPLPAAGSFARQEKQRYGRSAAGKKSGARRYLSFVAMAAAAAILLLLSPQIALYLKADYRTSIAGRQDVRLEDGTQISLNATSAIAVSYTRDARHVTLLKGEILVKVAADPQHRPFSLTSGDLVISDIGTTFDANVRDTSLTVSVEEGAVQVVYARFGASAKLGQNDRVRIDLATGRMDQDKVDGSRIGAWRSGQLIVDAMPVGDVVEELRRYYRGVIVLRDDNLTERKVSGVFDLYNPLGALDAVVEPFAGKVQQWTPYFVTVAAPVQTTAEKQ